MDELTKVVALDFHDSQPDIKRSDADIVVCWGCGADCKVKPRSTYVQCKECGLLWQEFED